MGHQDALIISCIKNIVIGPAEKADSERLACAVLFVQICAEDYSLN